METAALHYDLPDSAIAQQPMEPRDAARLLVVTAGGTEHLNVRDLDALVDRGDILVVNDTKVMPARLHLAKATGGAVEVLLFSRLADGWECGQPGQQQERCDYGGAVSHARLYTYRLYTLMVTTRVRSLDRAAESAPHAPLGKSQPAARPAACPGQRRSRGRDRGGLLLLERRYDWQSRRV